MNRFFNLLLLLIPLFLLFGCVTINQTAVDARLFSPCRTNTVTAVQVSDAHFSREKPLFDNTIALINELNPDIIFFTGDQAVSEKSIAVMKHYLSQITVSCPKLAINGNWEYTKEVPFTEYKAALKESGFTLLENAQCEYDFNGKKLCVYGVDDYLFGKPSFDAFVPCADGANAVLAHCPPLFDSLIASRANADAQKSVPIVMLSGHTHGGQFTFFGKAVYFPIGTGSYYSGFYQNGDYTLYVSTGLGNSAYDIRNVPPVIDVITFVYNEQNGFVSVNAQALTVPK